MLCSHVVSLVQQFLIYLPLLEYVLWDIGRLGFGLCVAGVALYDIYEFLVWRELGFGWLAGMKGWKIGGRARILLDGGWFGVFALCIIIIW